MIVQKKNNFNMKKKIQLLTLTEWARKYGVNPYDKSGYDYMYAYKNNLSPDKDGNWPKIEEEDE